MMKSLWFRLSSAALVAVFALTAGCGPTIRAISGQTDAEMFALALRVAGLQDYAEKDAAFGKGMSEVTSRHAAAIEIIRADIAALKRKAGIENDDSAAASAAPSARSSAASILPPAWAADVLNLAGLAPTSRE